MKNGVTIGLGMSYHYRAWLLRQQTNRQRPFNHTLTTGIMGKALWEIIAHFTYRKELLQELIQNIKQSTVTYL